MRLLRAYPTAWRARYGDELAGLIEELDGDARLSWSVRFDVVRAGLVERARVLGVGALPPRERAREGALLVLYSWMLFVLGGFGVLKASEHWKAVTPAAKRGLPAAAFDVLFVAAGVGSTLVLVGVAPFLPRLAALVRQGDWKDVRRPIIRAVSLSLVTAAATFGLARWAHSLTPGARNGRDASYSAAFVAWIILLAACLFGWAAAAAATARRLSPLPRLLRFEVWLGAAVSAAMVVMTIATTLWWGSLARAAPWFFEGRPVGSRASAFVSNMVIPEVMMLLATTLGLIGAIQALNALAKAPAGSKMPQNPRSR
jgi:hypothetical protein